MSRYDRWQSTSWGLEAERDEARRVIAAVEALCDRKGVRIWNSELRAALASGDGTEAR